MIACSCGLETRCPKFDQLLGVKQCDGTKVVAVTIPSQRRQVELSECECVACERESGAIPNLL